MTPIPVTLIAGYLGAGKTTVLNHLLADTHGRRICVLVNDFGEIALDEDLIDNRSGDTVALSNGCMCCTIGNDFFAAIDRILRMDPRPEHLVIETSGVADPFKVGQIALAEPDLHLQGVITVVDAVNFGPSLADHYLGDTLRGQLAVAGLIVITKPDLVTPDELDSLRQTLTHLSPGTPRVVADHGRVPSEMLLEPMRVHIKRPDPAAHEHHHHDHGVDYRGWVWSGDARVTADALDGLLTAPVAGLYRLKGMVQLVDDSWCTFHRAGAQAERHPSPPPRLGKHGRAVGVGLSDRFDPADLDQVWAAVLQRS
ncbi:MAG: CobW family GTP-binding protein [Paracoccaceae bacterium]